MWNLKKWYDDLFLIFYFTILYWFCQGRNRDTDVEMDLWTQQGKERMGQTEKGIEIYTLSWVK